eukprot:18682-Pyramimonas_sp.AAC.1
MQGIFKVPTALLGGIEVRAAKHRAHLGTVLDEEGFIGPELSRRENFCAYIQTPAAKAYLVSSEFTLRGGRPAFHRHIGVLRATAQRWRMARPIVSAAR